MISIRTKRLIWTVTVIIVLITAFSLIPQNVYTTDSTVYKSTDGKWSYKFVDGNSVGIEITSGIRRIPAYLGESTEVSVPREIDGYRVVAIGQYAFYDNRTLESVVIPDTVTLVDDFGFALCSALKSVTLSPNLSRINEHAFTGCSSLTRLELPDSMTDIACRAFFDCTGLSEINIPDSLVSLGVNAFENTAILNGSPDGLRIDNCLVLAGKKMNGVCQIEQGIVTIGGGAFNDCTDMTDVIIPDSVRNISDSAFCNCNSLESIEIPDGVENIGGFAFDGCTSLKSIKIGRNASFIGTGIAHGCFLLERISVSDENKYYCSPDGVLYNGSRSELICYPAMKSDEKYSVEKSVEYLHRFAFYGCVNLKEVKLDCRIITVPEHCFEICEALEKVVLPAKLTAIDDCAFYKCKNLKEVVLPDRLESIGSNAFSLCISLSEVNFPSSLKSVGADAYSGCSALKRLTIPDSDILFRSGVFRYCISLESVEIPDSVTGINSYMFTGCSALRELTVGNGVRLIADCAFENCTSLESVTIPKSVLDIEKYAFSGCTALKQLKFERGVRLIKGYAFFGCVSLESVAFPEGLDTVGSMAFSGCSSLREITAPESVTMIESGAFDGCGDITVYGYDGTYAQNYSQRKNIRFVSLGIGAPEYKDLRFEDWYYDIIRYCVHRGFMNGMSNELFGSTDTMQRQDLVVILARIAGADLSQYENAQSQFTDVESDCYYAAALNWSVEAGITNGYGDGRFGVGDPVTREHAVTMLYRFLSMPQIENSEDALSEFSDADRIDGFARDAFVWAVHNGYISGMDGNTLAPEAEASRAQIAAILMRMDKDGAFLLQ